MRFEYIEMEFKPADFKRVIWYAENMYSVFTAEKTSWAGWLPGDWEPGGVCVNLYLKNEDEAVSIFVGADLPDEFRVYMRDKRIVGHVRHYQVEYKEWSENESELWQVVKQFEGEIAKIIVHVFPGSEEIKKYGHMQDGGANYLLPEPNFAISWHVAEYQEDEEDEEYEEEAEEEEVC